MDATRETASPSTRSTSRAIDRSSATRWADSTNSATNRGTIMVKNGSAVWKGGLKDGGGTVSTETGVLNNAPYGFKARFETGPGTNPEELIGAAHAGCFSMAFSLILGNAGLTADY